MRILISCTAIISMLVSTPLWGQSVSRTIKIENSSHKCVNVTNNAVTFYVTSIKVEKKGSIFADVTSIGMQTDVTLKAAGGGGDPKFPVIRQLSSAGVKDGMFSAGVQLPLLAQYVFDPKVTTFEAPVTFLKTKGDSKVSRYAKALLRVANSPLIPPNPFVEGMQMAGNLAGSFLDSASQGEAENILKTEMQISNTLSRRNTCGANDLLDGTQALINSPSNNQIPDTIDPNARSNYCFYADGPLNDPEILFGSRPSNGCAQTIPDRATLKVLKNPQLIYVVSQIPKSQLAPLRGRMISRNLGSVSGSQVGIVGPASPKIRELSGNTAVQRAAEICLSGGLTLNECFTAPQADLISVE